MKDGREVECDAIILACGTGGAKTILEKVDEEIFSSNFANLSPKFASIEAGLSSKPMAGKHCLIDFENNAAIIDYMAIQNWHTGSHIKRLSLAVLKIVELNA